MSMRFHTHRLVKAPLISGMAQRPGTADSYGDAVTIFVRWADDRSLELVEDDDVEHALFMTDCFSKER